MENINLLLKGGWKILIYLLSGRENNSIRRISLEKDMTHSDVSAYLTQFEGIRLLTKTKVGRTKEIKLTDKGKRVAEHLRGIAYEIEKDT